ncbi:hypothetical protein EDD68_10481 [Melghiribacillus thermohalophilus]|uniref:Uncharacterized protein n=1 Tax=Melghiribacillus thermohalophilus TaxID=1324956 RepID=A0A4R3NCU2_9BACI|nr:hypothetical protein [Melghiribacillus thermohalophilus]TCT25013.1 hypothetical protein EDD68_10481 [Melghiribacillus thermohalophilus]
MKDYSAEELWKKAKKNLPKGYQIPDPEMVKWMNVKKDKTSKPLSRKG